jgi:hypothetical protein
MKFEDPEAQAGLQEALDVAGNTHTLGDVAQMILDGRAQLWESEGAVIVTEVHRSPRVKAVHLWLATGTIGAVVDLSKLVLEWAKSVGCTSATITGRKGWERVGSHHGWTPLYTVLGQEL